MKNFIRKTNFSNIFEHFDFWRNVFIIFDANFLFSDASFSNTSLTKKTVKIFLRSLFLNFTDTYFKFNKKKF